MIGHLMAIDGSDGHRELDESVALGWQAGLGLFTAPTERDIARGLRYERPKYERARRLYAVYYDGPRSGGRYWRHEVRHAAYRELHRDPFLPWLYAPQTVLEPDLFLRG